MTRSAAKTDQLHEPPGRRCHLKSPVRRAKLPPARPRPQDFPLVLERGSLRFRIFQQKRGDYISHTLSYRLHGQRHRLVRADYTDLLRQVDVVETAIANGETECLNFSASDRALLQRLCELAADVAPLEVLVNEALEARARAAQSRLVPKSVPEIVAELLATKRRAGKCGEKWLVNLEAMLNRLAQFWTGPLHLVRAADLNRFLRGLPGGLVYRAHVRAAVVELCRHARAADYLPRDWPELEFVETVEPPAAEIVTWSTAQLAQFLAVCPPSLRPFAVLQAFGGLRHEEIVSPDPRKRRLDWSDIDWEEGHIRVGARTAKTRTERHAPLTDNCVAWLTPLRKETGPICALKQPACELDRTKRRAGLPAKRSASKNVLRHSFASYRLAVVKHIGQVADEMGNTPQMIKAHYLKRASERAGKKWFSLRPEDVTPPPASPQLELWR